MPSTMMRAAVLAALLLSAACAEQQAAAPAPVPDDNSLTCSSIAKEREANDKALRVTYDPYLASTNFTRSTPFIEAHAKAPALQARQGVLDKLAAKRGC